MARACRGPRPRAPGRDDRHLPRARAGTRVGPAGLQAIRARAAGRAHRRLLPGPGGHVAGRVAEPEPQGDGSSAPSWSRGLRPPSESRTSRTRWAPTTTRWSGGSSPRRAYRIGAGGAGLDTRPERRGAARGRAARSHRVPAGKPRRGPAFARRVATGSRAAWQRPRPAYPTPPRRPRTRGTRSTVSSAAVERQPTAPCGDPVPMRTDPIAFLRFVLRSGDVELARRLARALVSDPRYRERAAA